MAGTIFINYRRAENTGEAQHLATLLAKEFGSKRIFLDLRGIDGGDHWLHTLERQVAASDAMVVVIGKGWADLKDEEGNRRLDDPRDFVCFEIEQALKEGIPILPVLVDGAPMPRSAHLPAHIRKFALFQAKPLRADSVEQDAEAIARQLKVLVRKRQSRRRPAWAMVVGVAAALVAGIAIGPFLQGSLGVGPVARLKTIEQERDALSEALTGVRRMRDTLSIGLQIAEEERDRARKELTDLKAGRRKPTTDPAKVAKAERDCQGIGISASPGSAAAEAFWCGDRRGATRTIVMQSLRDPTQSCRSYATKPFAQLYQNELYEEAVELAKAGEFDDAFELIDACQCHNPAAQAKIREGRLAMLCFLRTREPRRH